jgi:hypothetical protein
MSNDSQANKMFMRMLHDRECVDIIEVSNCLCKCNTIENRKWVDILKQTNCL